MRASPTFPSIQGYSAFALTFEQPSPERMGFFVSLANP